MSDRGLDEVLAIDLGGTKVALALVDPDGRVVAETVRPTPASLDADAVFAPVEDGIGELLAGGAPVDLRVGIGTAGPLDAVAGTTSPVNIPAWRSFPVRDRVAAAVRGCGVREPRVGLAGDGHCFALGEHWRGAGRDVSSMVGVVLSTGIGGGAVLDGRLFAGASGNAVHLGHVSVAAWGPRCVCGGHGCAEMYARGPALVAAARVAGWQGSDARDLTADARAGHPVAVEVVDRGMRALAAAMAATATQLDVTVFVLGGGVARAGEVVFAPLRRHLADFAALHYVTGLEVRPAVLDNAGLLGAAALARTLS